MRPVGRVPPTFEEAGTVPSNFCLRLLINFSIRIGILTKNDRKYYVLNSQKFLYHIKLYLIKIKIIYLICRAYNNQSNRLVRCAAKPMTALVTWLGKWNRKQVGRLLIAQIQRLAVFVHCLMQGGNLAMLEAF